MGMSTEEFERQKARRFAILAIDEVPETVPGHQGAYDYGWCICEMRDGRPIRYIGDDACEPEDKCLVRDLAWVADALNEAATEAERLKVESVSASFRQGWDEAVSTFDVDKTVPRSQLDELRSQYLADYLVAGGLDTIKVVDRSDPNHPCYDVTPQYEPNVEEKKIPFHLLGRDQCEQELGFSYASASDVPFEQLQRVAVELHDLRRFRKAYDEMQAAFQRCTTHVE